MEAPSSGTCYHKSDRKATFFASMLILH